MTMFAMVETPELFIESVLGFHCDGNNFRRLALTAPIENKIGTTAMAIVPGGFDKNTTAVGL
jgi:hypothetical protein